MCDEGIVAMLLIILCHPSAHEALRKKCPYLELFWSVFPRIRTEYGEIRSIFPYSVRMRKNTDQNNSEYGHFSRSQVYFKMIQILQKVVTRKL